MQKTIYYMVAVLLLLSTNSFGNKTIDVTLEHHIPQLNSESVISIYRDSKGFLWVGTYMGLFVSNGSNYETYYPKPSNPNSINSATVYKIYEDTHNNIWVGTQKGLVKYNYSTKSFSQHIPDNINNTWTYKEIRDICEDINGNIWCVSYNNNGLIKYNPNTQNEEVFRIPEVPDMRLNTIEYFDNTLWIGTEINGLYSYNLIDSTWNCEIGSHNNKSLTINDIKIINDVLWMGTWNNGLLEYNPTTKKEIWHIESNPNANYFSGYTIRQITVDKDLNLWLASYNGGIDKYNIKTKEVVHLSDLYRDYSHQEPHYIWSIFCDEQNILWIGTINSGLTRVYLNAALQKLLTCTINNKQEIIYSINDALEYDNNIWIATNKQGLIKYNISTHTGKQVELIKNEPDCYVGCIEMDKANRLWISSDKGLFIVNPVNNTIISHLSNVNSHLKDKVESPSFLYADTDGDLWFAAWQTGLLRIPFQKTNNTFDTVTPVRYLVDNNNPHAIANNNIVNIYQYADSLFFVSGTYFIQHFNKKSNRFSFFEWFDGQEMVRDDKQRLWISSNIKGTVYYNLENEKLKFFGENKSVSSNISGLFKAKNATWFIKKNNLIRLTTSNNHIDYFKVDAGFKKMKYNNSSFELSNKKLFIGGNIGCYIYNPNKYKPADTLTARPLHLFIYNKKVNVNDTIEGHVILKKSIDIQDSITIPAGIKSFSIELTSQNFIDPEATTYAYRMIGLDSTWHILNYPQRKALFNNLMGGNYVFQMAIYNPYYNWQAHAKSLHIQVKIPFYKTIGFKLLILLLSISIVFLMFFIRQKRLNKINIELETIVEKRTKELIASNKNLIEQTKELIEKQEHINEQNEEIKLQRNKLLYNNEQLEILNSTKDKFFSIIGHDLKGPVGAISGLLDIIHEGFDSFTKLHLKQMIEEAKLSSQSVYKLVNNLLYWANSITGKLEFKPKEINIIKTIYENIRITHLNSREKNIRSELICKEPEILVYADEDMLNFILRNLISNAIKFTPIDGMVKINLTKQTDEVILSIQDNGIGISEEQIKNLFSITKQVSTTGTNNEKGTGLGLILTKSFVDKHNGEIWVESTPNKGSTFFVRLPKP